MNKMVEYFKFDNKNKIDDKNEKYKYVMLDENNRATIIYIEEIVAQRDDIMKRLNTVPNLTDEELLVWAKQNHPNFTDTSQEEKELIRINEIYEAIKVL